MENQERCRHDDACSLCSIKKGQESREASKSSILPLFSLDSIVQQIHSSNSKIINLEARKPSSLPDFQEAEEEWRSTGHLCASLALKWKAIAARVKNEGLGLSSLSAASPASPAQIIKHEFTVTSIYSVLAQQLNRIRGGSHFSPNEVRSTLISELLRPDLKPHYIGLAGSNSHHVIHLLGKKADSDFLLHVAEIERSSWASSLFVDAAASAFDVQIQLFTSAFGSVQSFSPSMSSASSLQAKSSPQQNLNKKTLFIAQLDEFEYVSLEPLNGKLPSSSLLNKDPYHQIIHLSSLLKEYSLNIRKQINNESLIDRMKEALNMSRQAHSITHIRDASLPRAMDALLHGLVSQCEREGSSLSLQLSLLDSLTTSTDLIHKWTSPLSSCLDEKPLKSSFKLFQSLWISLSFALASESIADSIQNSVSSEFKSSFAYYAQSISIKQSILDTLKQILEADIGMLKTVIKQAKEHILPLLHQHQAEGQDPIATTSFHILLHTILSIVPKEPEQEHQPCPSSSVAEGGPSSIIEEAEPIMDEDITKHDTLCVNAHQTMKKISVSVELLIMSNQNGTYKAATGHNNHRTPRVHVVYTPQQLMHELLKNMNPFEQMERKQCIQSVLAAAERLQRVSCDLGFKELMSSVDSEDPKKSLEQMLLKLWQVKSLYILNQALNMTRKRIKAAVSVSKLDGEMQTLLVSSILIPELDESLQQSSLFFRTTSDLLAAKCVKSSASIVKQLLNTYMDLLQVQKSDLAHITSFHASSSSSKEALKREDSLTRLWSLILHLEECIRNRFAHIAALPPSLNISPIITLQQYLHSIVYDKYKAEKEAFKHEHGPNADPDLLFFEPQDDSGPVDENDDSISEAGSVRLAMGRRSSSLSPSIVSIPSWRNSSASISGMDSIRIKLPEIQQDSIAERIHVSQNLFQQVVVFLRSHGLAKHHWTASAASNAKHDPLKDEFGPILASTRSHHIESLRQVLLRSLSEARIASSEISKRFHIDGNGSKKTSPQIKKQLKKWTADATQVEARAWPLLVQITKQAIELAAAAAHPEQCMSKCEDAVLIMPPSQQMHASSTILSDLQKSLSASLFSSSAPVSSSIDDIITHAVSPSPLRAAGPSASPSASHHHPHEDRVSSSSASSSSSSLTPYLVHDPQALSNSSLSSRTALLNPDQIENVPALLNHLIYYSRFHLWCMASQCPSIGDALSIVEKWASSSGPDSVLDDSHLVQNVSALTWLHNFPLSSFNQKDTRGLETRISMLESDWRGRIFGLSGPMLRCVIDGLTRALLLFANNSQTAAAVTATEIIVPMIPSHVPMDEVDMMTSSRNVSELMCGLLRCLPFEAKQGDAAACAAFMVPSSSTPLLIAFLSFVQSEISAVDKKKQSSGEDAVDEEEEQEQEDSQQSHPMAWHLVTNGVTSGSIQEALALYNSKKRAYHPSTAQASWLLTKKDQASPAVGSRLFDLFPMICNICHQISESIRTQNPILASEFALEALETRCTMQELMAQKNSSSASPHSGSAASPSSVLSATFLLRSLVQLQDESSSQGNTIRPLHLFELLRSFQVRLSQRKTVFEEYHELMMESSDSILFHILKTVSSVRSDAFFPSAWTQLPLLKSMCNAALAAGQQYTKSLSSPISTLSDSMIATRFMSMTSTITFNTLVSYSCNGLVASSSPEYADLWMTLSTLVCDQSLSIFQHTRQFVSEPSFESVCVGHGIPKPEAPLITLLANGARPHFADRLTLCGGESVLGNRVEYIVDILFQMMRLKPEVKKVLNPFETAGKLDQFDEFAPVVHYSSKLFAILQSELCEYYSKVSTSFQMQELQVHKAAIDSRMSLSANNNESSSNSSSSRSQKMEKISGLLLQLSSGLELTGLAVEKHMQAPWIHTLLRYPHIGAVCKYLALLHKCEGQPLKATFLSAHSVEIGATMASDFHSSSLSEWTQRTKEYFFAQSVDHKSLRASKSRENELVDFIQGMLDRLYHNPSSPVSDSSHSKPSMFSIQRMYEGAKRIKASLPHGASWLFFPFFFITWLLWMLQTALAPVFSGVFLLPLLLIKYLLLKMTRFPGKSLHKTLVYDLHLAQARSQMSSVLRTALYSLPAIVYLAVCAGVAYTVLYDNQSYLYNVLSGKESNLYWYWFTPSMMDLVLVAISLCFVSWPTAPPRDQRFYARRQRALHHTCVIIPAGQKSQGVIGSTLRHALGMVWNVPFFTPEQIIVAHNGDSKAPTDDTAAICREVSREFNARNGRPNIPENQILYAWIGIGNKTHATWFAAKHIVDSKRFTHSLILDDHIALPQDFFAPTQDFIHDPNIKCISFLLTASGQSESFTRCYEDIELKKAGLFKLLQSKSGTCLSPLATLSLWDRQIMVSVLEQHDGTVHEQEDAQMGMLLHTLSKGKYRIKSSGVSLVKTCTGPDHISCFDNLFCEHVTKSVLAQRVRNKYVAHPRLFFSYLKLFIFFWSKNVLGLKLFLVNELWCYATDFFRIPLMALMLYETPVLFGISMAAISVLQVISLAFFNWWNLRRRSDLRMKWYIVLTYPIYNFMLLLYRWIGVMYSLLFYIPTSVKNMPPINTWHLYSDLDDVPEGNKS